VGGGNGAPPDGISPAKAEDERTHARAIVIRDRFMDVSPLSLAMQDFLHQIQ
jgi:hypothetical protein